MKKIPFLTVMVIPHSEDGTRALRIPIYLVRIVSILLLVSLLYSFLWAYQYTYSKRQNQTLQLSKAFSEEVIEEYSDNYLSLYQEVANLQSRVVEVQELEEQLRQKNDFELTENFIVGEQFDGSVILDYKDPKIVALSINEAKSTIEVLKDAVPSKENSLNELIRLMEDRNEALLSIPSIYPTVGRFTSYFGYRTDPFNGNRSFHDGVDIANNYGTQVYATADGIVTYSGYNGGYGNMITINHGNGFETLYAHNSKLLVKKGAFVRKGQLISYMGSTGRSTGPHLHYEVKKYGVKVNPTKYLN